MRIIIFLFIFLLLLVVKSKYESRLSKSVAVISACGPIDGILELCDEFSLQPIVYEKCSSCSEVPKDVVCEIRKNVGREQETFLHFVITHYDDLPDEIVFIAAPISKHNREERIRKILKDDFIGCEGTLEGQDDFLLDTYMDSPIEPANIRPFKNWYQTFIKKWDSNEKTACWNGIMKTTKERILQKPKNFYEKLLNQVNTHNSPEVGHYMERSMGSIF